MIDDECQLHSSHGQVEGSSSTDPFLERIDGLGRLCLSASQRPIAPPDALLERCDAVLRAAGDELQESQLARVAQSYFYKAVAKIEGRFFSVFDGMTEFKLGERIEREQCHGRKAAFFVHTSAEAARIAQFPESSKALHEARAILLVRSDARPRHVHGKVMLWEFTPLLEVCGRPKRAEFGRGLPPQPNPTFQLLLIKRAMQAASRWAAEKD